MLKPLFNRQQQKIKILRQNLWAVVVLCLAMIALSSCRNFNTAHTQQGIGPANLIRLINMNPADYTNELNKVYPGWQFEPGKNRWVNSRHNSALAIRENELRLMEPVEYAEAYPPYFENHNFNLISTGAPADTSKTGKKIFEDTDYIFTIQTNQKYVMTSLGGR